MKLKTLTFALSALSLVGLSKPVFAEDKEFNSMDIMAESLSLSCIDFELTGVCFWLKCKAFPPSCSVQTSLRVRHYNPDAIVQVYQHPGDTPWKEMSFVSKLLKLGQEGGTPTGAQNSKRRKQTSKIINRHVDVIGSPGMLPVSALLSGGSALSELTEVLSDTSNIVGSMQGMAEQSTSIIDEIGSNEYSRKMNELSDSLGENLSFLNDMTSDLGIMEMLGSFSGALGVLSDLLNAANTVSEIMEQFKSVTEVINNLSALSDLQSGVDGLSSLLGFGEDSFNYYCGDDVTPYIPYYVSTLDQFSWKYPYAEFLNMATWVPGMREVGNRSDGSNEQYLFTGRFGNVYPRIGSLIQNDHYKASAVFAQRAADIVTDPSSLHLKITLGKQSGKGSYEPPGQIKEWTSKAGKWQMLYPKIESKCHIFGDPSTRRGGDGYLLDEYSYRRSKNGNYAWQLWRPYECCKPAGQIFLYSLKFQ